MDVDLNTDHAWFERAQWIAAARADHFLRFHLSEYPPNQETGHVESPTGHVALTFIYKDAVAKWVTSEGDPWMSERRNFTPGWYIIQTTNLGFIHGYHYATDADAQADFDDLDRAYEIWGGGQGL